MAVNKKGLRKVNFKGKQYFWRVDETGADVPEQGFVSHPPAARVLHIIAADKRFIVHYQLPQPGDTHATLLVEGPFFPRAPGRNAVHVPRWRHDSKRYPTADFVRRLIAWCMEAPGRGE